MNTSFSQRITRTTTMFAFCLLLNALASLTYASNERKAEQAFQQGRFTEAARMYQRLIIQNGEKRLYRWRIANSYHIQGKYQAASEQLQRLLQQNPSDEEVLTLYALTAEKLSDWASAESTYKTLVSLDADNDNALSGLEKAYRQQNKIQQADKVNAEYQQRFSTATTVNE